MARAQLVTVVGPAGAGKTRLALEIGGRIADDREVRLVELAPIVDPRPSTRRWPRPSAPRTGPRPARAIDHRPRADRAVERLGNRRVVVVLDNCEHVLDAAAAIAARLLAGCPGLRIVATSREPLGIDGEHQVAVGSLTDDDAATLFAERARAAQPGVRGRPSRRRRVVPAPRRAPARHRARRGTQQDAAGPGDHGATPGPFQPARRSAAVLTADRQRALRAAIDWSYDLLVRTGTAGVPPAGGVRRRVHERRRGRSCAAPTRSTSSPGSSTSRCSSPTTSGPTARFHMLESLRDYGLDRLADDG